MLRVGAVEVLVLAILPPYDAPLVVCELDQLLHLQHLLVDVRHENLLLRDQALLAAALVADQDRSLSVDFDRLRLCADALLIRSEEKQLFSFRDLLRAVPLVFHPNVLVVLQVDGLEHAFIVLDLLVRSGHDTPCLAKNNADLSRAVVQEADKLPCVQRDCCLHSLICIMGPEKDLFGTLLNPLFASQSVGNDKIFKLAQRNRLSCRGRVEGRNPFEARSIEDSCSCQRLHQDLLILLRCHESKYADHQGISCSHLYLCPGCCVVLCC
mmetsp:Transcript_28055/g.66365  ORF Transcript_28055/g.66365 Transcript_28055/m.66365 type:complete len:268 (-) Transcript_28055:10-813(-)